MLTDTQLTGLRLALDNAGALGIDVEPWNYIGDSWCRRSFMMTGIGTYSSCSILPNDATSEHYDALCARYARKLRKIGGRLEREIEPDIGWMLVRGTFDPIHTVFDCPDDELTALVHALAAAEGKGVQR